MRLLAVAAVLVGMLAGTAPAARAQTADAALRTKLGRALAVPHVNRALSAAIAVELSTGRVVYQRNASLSLAPASTEKLAVSYALLTTFGPAYRIQTRVLGNGSSAGATWRGDIVLKGYGDPTLSSAGLKRLAAQVRATGVRRVVGRVLGDETFFDARRTAPGWRASFYIEQSAPLSSLVVDHARYGWRHHRNPAVDAARRFRAALVAAGISVSGPAAAGSAYSEDSVLAAISSPPVLQMLKRVNRDSDNFTAEVLLKHLGAVQHGQGTTAAGAAEARRMLANAGVPLAGVRLADGSGLSLQNRVTAQMLVGILRAAWNDPLLRGSFLSSLAVAGETGTMKSRLRAPPARGQVFAKTGTTRSACTLAGFVSGRYVFAVLHNGPPLSHWWAREAQNRFATVLAK